MEDDLFNAIAQSDFEALRRFLVVQGGPDATVAVPLAGGAAHNATEAHRDPVVVTPLMVACKLGNFDAVKILASSNCNVNKATSVTGGARALYKRAFSHADFWASPLILASAAGRSDIVGFLLRARASPDKTSIVNHRLEAVSPLFVACASGNIHVVDLLLRYGARANVVCAGLAPIHMACRAGNPEVVAALIRNGSSVNCKDDEFGCTPLHEAAKMGWTDTVQVLLASGASADALSSTQNAGFSRAHQSLLPALPVNSTNCTRLGVSALTLAVAGAHWDTAAALLGHEGTSPNVPDTHGRVPLHYLCGGRPGRRDCGPDAEVRAFHALLRAGADLERRDHNGFKGLHYAAAMNKWKLLEVWVAQLGRHVSNRGSNKETCLHLACAFGSAEATGVLLDSGKFIQAYNDDGLLPFHLACSHGSVQIVELLLRRGACPHDIPTLYGETGVGLARTNGHHGVVDFLERWAGGAERGSVAAATVALAGTRGPVRGGAGSIPLSATDDHSGSLQPPVGKTAAGASSAAPTARGPQQQSQGLQTPQSLHYLTARGSGAAPGVGADAGAVGGALQQQQELLAQQVGMERAALGELRSVRDAAEQRIELWRKFCQVYDELNR